MTTTILTTASAILAAPEQAPTEPELLEQATDENPEHAEVA
jgi:hypothetical protein